MNMDVLSIKFYITELKTMKAKYKVGDKVKFRKVFFFEKEIINIISDPITGEPTYEFKYSNFCVGESEIINIVEEEISCKELYKQYINPKS